MAEIKMLWSGATPTSQPSDDVRAWLTGRAVHLLRFFTFWPSTPSSVVAQLMGQAFFACDKTAGGSLPFVSTRGIFEARDVRMPHASLMAFLKEVPVVPAEVMAEAGLMVNRIKERGMLDDITLLDVFGELKDRVLTEDEMTECLKWWISLSQAPNFDISLRSRLLDVAVFTSSATNLPVPLSSIRTFYDPRRSTIPADLPLPTDTLPFAVSKSLANERLPHALGFNELTLPVWVAFLVSSSMSGKDAKDAETDMAVSAVFSERVLVVLSKAWNGLNAQNQVRFFSPQLALFVRLTCVCVTGPDLLDALRQEGRADQAGHGHSGRGLLP